MSRRCNAWPAACGRWVGTPVVSAGRWRAVASRTRSCCSKERVVSWGGRRAAGSTNPVSYWPRSTPRISRSPRRSPSGSSRPHPEPACRSRSTTATRPSPRHYVAWALPRTPGRGLSACFAPPTRPSRSPPPATPSARFAPRSSPHGSPSTAPPGSQRRCPGATDATSIRMPGAPGRRPPRQRRPRRPAGRRSLVLAGLDALPGDRQARDGPRHDQ
jgi:hypothetical protein